jgi:uncharacterized protein YfaT (DUF1175 family)
MRAMFASIKKLRVALGLLLWFQIVLLVSYFSLARTVNNGLETQPLNSLRERSGKKPDTALNKPERPPAEDSDNDGLPDTAELRTFNDRENFRRWFTWVAEMQFYKLSEQWNSGQRDCAGLVRFSWREALRRHDHAWYQRMGAEYEPVAPDISRTLEQGLLREKLFRTSFGTYKEDDIATRRFSEFADAQTLKTFNCDFISRDRRQAMPGDLLFFYQPWVQNFPYHVMIFLGEPRLSSEGTHDWVVYHTGASPTDEGVVKKVRLTVLDDHPNRRWRPIQRNPNFLGFYRLKILE